MLVTSYSHVIGISYESITKHTLLIFR